MRRISQKCPGLLTRHGMSEANKFLRQAEGFSSGGDELPPTGCPERGNAEQTHEERVPNAGNLPTSACPIYDCNRPPQPRIPPLPPRARTNNRGLLVGELSVLGSRLLAWEKLQQIKDAVHSSIPITGRDLFPLARSRNGVLGAMPVCMP